MRWLPIVIAALLMSVPHARAHRPSDSFLLLEPGDELDQPRGYWEIALRDLDQLYALDDGDGSLRWGELHAQEGVMLSALGDTLSLQRGGHACHTHLGALSIIEHSDGSYVHIPLAFECTREGAILIRYPFMAGVDAAHRLLLRVSGAAGEQRYVLRTGDTFSLPTQKTSHPRALLRDVESGVLHIWGGLDHVLFLVVLLSPAVLRREQSGFVPERALRPVLLDVVRVVSAFTVAHSLTLSLSALGYVRAASNVIEPAIAASVALAAANNLFPLVPEQRWAPAFALGLLHGFGFASALADAGLTHGALLRALLGFNVGVEIGQLGIVALFVPLAFLVRKRAAYRRYALGLGSYAVASVALFWFFQRIQWR